MNQPQIIYIVCAIYVAMQMTTLTDSRVEFDIKHNSRNEIIYDTVCQTFYLEVAARRSYEDMQRMAKDTVNRNVYFPVNVTLDTLVIWK